MCAWATSGAGADAGRAPDSAAAAAVTVTVGGAGDVGAADCRGVVAVAGSRLCAACEGAGAAAVLSAGGEGCMRAARREW